MAKATCWVPDCGRPVHANGLCDPHDQRRRKTGDVRADVPLRAPRYRRPPDQTCSASGCARTDLDGQDLCSMHYARWRNHGTTENMRGRYERKPKPKLPCSVDGCERVAQPQREGLCRPHRWRLTTNGGVGSAEIQPNTRYAPGQICSIDGCADPASRRGLCVKHYTRWHDHGDPLTLLRRERTPVRTCAWCLRTPDQVEFGRATKSPDGLTARCKPCHKAHGQLYFSGRKPGDPIIARKLARTRRWRRRNPERVREGQRNWLRANRHRAYENQARRRMRLRGTSNHIQKLDRRNVWEAFARLCGLCALPVPFENMHLDHIKPVAKGGSHTYGNVQPSHPRCNQRKRDREVAPWAYATADDRRRAESLLRSRSRRPTTTPPASGTPLLF